MKRLTIIFAVLLTATSIMADEFKIGKLTFEITSSTEVSLKSAEKDITKVYLGKTVDYQGKIYTLTEFGYRAFCDCSSLTSVTIPNSVTEIGNSAFSGCSSLTSVTIPNSVTEIEAGAFYGCQSLTSATIPNSVKWIGEYAFEGCKSLTSVTIPNSVTEIGWKVFEGTALYNNPANWENGALYISDCLVEVDTSFVGNFKIKEKTRLIADLAFGGCKSLTSVTIPNSLTHIGDGVFIKCESLPSITIPNSVTEIGAGVFKGCTSLTSVTIPDGVTKIGEDAFRGCKSLNFVTIPNSVTEIEGSAFAGCESLTSVTIPNNVTEIKRGAFHSCSSLTSIAIPNSVTSIGPGAFYGTAYYDDPSNWENGALYINDCLIEVDTSFVGNYTIKENTHLIADWAFQDCSSLTSVTIPNSVTSIGEYAFRDCSSLISMNIPNSVIKIRGGAFSGCKLLTSVTIPNSVKKIGEEAFWGCTSLTSIAIPSSVTSIGYSAFCGCTSLRSITIPSNVTEIVSRAFVGCSSLKSVTIPNSVTLIGWDAFKNCSSLTSVTIPNSVTSIGEDAFHGCTSLTSVTIPNSVTKIGNSAFCGCTSLRHITIPRRLESKGKIIFCDSFDFATIHYTETDSNNNNNSSSKGKTEEEPLIIRNVQLQEDGETYSVPAVEGQLVLMFDEDMSHEESLDILEEKGLSIISSIPELNYYLIQVPVGEEGQYFSQLNDNDLVDYVYPNTIEYFCSASAYALDDYVYTDHGSRVSKMLTGCDTMMDIANCDPLVNLEEKNVAAKINGKIGAGNWKTEEALSSILFSHSKQFTSSSNPVVINMSIGPSLYDQEGNNERVLWSNANVTEENRIDYRRRYVNSLKGLIKLVKKYNKEDFVIVKSTGNNGMKQLETIIDTLMSELTWDELKVFERHFILVSAKDDYRIVDYPTDVSRYHKMVSKVDISDVTRQDTAWRGTSFSSPRLAGYIYKLAEKYDLPATTVLRFVRSATEKAIDNVVTYELIEEEITSYHRVVVDFVDLGLPSGTLWKAINEPGLYTYQEANDKFVSEEENLPTYEQLFELKQECQWGRTDTGYELLGPNGNSITFSAEGYFDCAGYPHYINGGAGIFGNETIGMIWSSTPTDADKAYSMGIGTYNAGIIQADECCYGRSVHLVQSGNSKSDNESANPYKEVELADDLIGQIIYDPSENSYFPEDWSWTIKQGEVLGVDVLARDFLQDCQNIRVLVHLHKDAIKIDAELTMHYVKSGNGYTLQSTTVNKFTLLPQTDYSQHVTLEMDYTFMPLLMLHNNSDMTLLVGGEWSSKSNSKRFITFVEPNSSETIAMGAFTSYNIHFAYRK